MKIATKTVYISDDGTEHPTKEACELHDLKVKVFRDNPFLINADVPLGRVVTILKMCPLSALKTFHAYIKGLIDYREIQRSGDRK